MRVSQRCQRATNSEGQSEVRGRLTMGVSQRSGVD